MGLPLADRPDLAVGLCVPLTSDVDAKETPKHADSPHTKTLPALPGKRQNVNVVRECLHHQTCFDLSQTSVRSPFACCRRHRFQGGGGGWVWKALTPPPPPLHPLETNLGFGFAPSLRPAGVRFCCFCHFFSIFLLFLFFPLFR